MIIGTLLASGLGSSEVCLFNVPQGDNAAATNAKECGRLRGHHAAVAVLYIYHYHYHIISYHDDAMLMLYAYMYDSIENGPHLVMVVNG